MSLNQASFQEFRETIRKLGETVQPVEGLTDDERVRRAKQVFLTRVHSAMAMDLETCIHCGMCAEACHFYAQTKNAKYTPILKVEPLRRFYRRELGPQRWLYRLVSRDIDAQMLEEWQELVYDSCTECGRCSMICPMGINVSAMINVVRQAVAEAGYMPDELRAVEKEQKEKGTTFGVGPTQLREALEKMRQNGVDVPVDKDKAEVMVLISGYGVNITQDALLATVKIMNHLGVDWTIRTDAYECAHFGMLSGREQTLRNSTLRVINAALSCGAKTVVTGECGYGYTALRWEGARRYGKPLPFEVMSISEFMGQQLKAGRLKVRKLNQKKSITLHDPCKVGRIGGVFKEPRALLNALGVEIREMADPVQTSWCCGGGGGVFLNNRATPLRQAAFESKRSAAVNTGAESVVVSCDSCRMTFEIGKVHAHWEMPIESLVVMVGENLADP
jgi:Fe-S oxidoreductase